MVILITNTSVTLADILRDLIGLDLKPRFILVDDSFSLLISIYSIEGFISEHSIIYNSFV